MLSWSNGDIIILNKNKLDNAKQLTFCHFVFSFGFLKSNTDSFVKLYVRREYQFLPFVT